MHEHRAASRDYARSGKKHSAKKHTEHAVMRKWWDFMADIMETREGNMPVAQPLVPGFHLP